MLDLKRVQRSEELLEKGSRTESVSGPFEGGPHGVLSVPHGVLRGPHGSSGVLMRSSGVLMVPQGSSWGPHGSSWGPHGVLMVPQCSSWVPQGSSWGPHGSSWFLRGPRGSLGVVGAPVCNPTQPEGPD